MPKIYKYQVELTYKLLTTVYAEGHGQAVTFATESVEFVDKTPNSSFELQPSIDVRRED